MILDFSNWKVNELNIINPRPQKINLHILYMSDNSFIYESPNKKFILKLTLDHNEAYAWNQLKAKPVKYSTLTYDVTKISYGLYGVCYEKLTLLNDNLMTTRFKNDFSKNIDYNKGQFDWLEYQLNHVKTLSLEAFNSHINSINMQHTNTGKFIQQIYENTQELLKYKLAFNKIELGQIGYNHYGRACMIDLEGQLLTPINRMSEFILDPYPEIIMQFGLNSTFGKTTEVTRNVHRMARIYYQYLLNTKKIKI